MKREEEIQRAHDLMRSLHSIADFGDEASTLRAITHTLCWVLDHDYKNRIADVFLEIEAILYGKGIELVDSGELHVPDG